MARMLIRGDSVFLDSAYAIALASVTDELHAKALALSEEMEEKRTRLVTTQAVLLEIGNSLSKGQYCHGAIRLLRSLRADPVVEIVPFRDQLFDRALELFSDRPDKEWGLTDCISFVVMNAQGVTEALTADVHFQQAGFRALLREPHN